MLRYFKDPPHRTTNERLAQTVTFCQLCEKNHIRWKCVDCSDLFCDACKMIHERGKATRNHQITAVKDLNEEMLGVFIFNLQCPSHNFVCSMYCATCNQCACANCVTDNHTGHTFQDLKALLGRKRQEMKTTLNQLDSEVLPKLRKQLESMPGYIREHKQNIDFLKLEVQKRGQRLKDAIDQTMNHQMSELSMFSKDRLVKFSTHEAAILQQMQELQDRRIIVEELIQPSNIHEVTSLLTSSNLLSNIHLLVTTEFVSAGFVPGQLQETNVQREFGSLCFKRLSENHEPIRRTAPHEEGIVLEEATPHEQRNVALMSIEELQTLKTNLSSVTSIAMALNDAMWVGCANTRKLQLIDVGGHMKELPPVMTNVLGFSLSSNGDLYITDVDNRKVRKRCLSSGKLTLFYEFKTLFPVSIYVDVGETPNMVYVGLLDSLTKINEDYENVTGAVVKMSVTGKVITKTFKQLKTSDEKLFTVPNRIVVNSFVGSLVVIDSISKETGRVIAISKDDGSFRFIYSRSHNHTDNPFNPSDLVCTNEGKIIICDGSNDLLYVLNHDGRLYQCIDTKSQGIRRPWSLALTDRNKLCIGTFTYKGGKQTKEAQNGVVYITEFCV